MSKDELPSIEDFNRDDNLPSIKDFITEEKAEELPSVEDYVEKKEEILTEATQTIEDADGNSFTEIKDIVPPWPELVKMVNDVRADIPDIPENVRKGILFYPATTMDDVLKHSFNKKFKVKKKTATNKTKATSKSSGKQPPASRLN